MVGFVTVSKVYSKPLSTFRFNAEGVPGARVNRSVLWLYSYTVEVAGILTDVVEASCVELIIKGEARHRKAPGFLLLKGNLFGGGIDRGREILVAGALVAGGEEEEGAKDQMMVHARKDIQNISYYSYYPILVKAKVEANNFTFE